MQLSSSASILWFVTMGLDVVLAALIVRLRVFRKFLFFSLFIAISSARTVFLWAVYHYAGYESPLAIYAFWYSQPVLLISRGVMCAELCQFVLARYRGLWPVAFSALLLTGGGVLIYAVTDSVRVRMTFNAYRFIYALERGIELSISVSLILLLLIALRYKIRIERTPLLLVSGLCFFSLMQLLNTTLAHPLIDQWSLYSSLRVATFQLTQVVWLFALFQRNSTAEPAAVQVVPRVYREHAEKTLENLQVMEAELEEIARR
jgi:hypothetical protein